MWNVMCADIKLCHCIGLTKIMYKTLLLQPYQFFHVLQLQYMLGRQSV